MADATTADNPAIEPDSVSENTTPQIEPKAEPVTWEATRIGLTLTVDERPLAQVTLEIGVRKEDKAILDPLLDHMFRLFYERAQQG